MKSYRDILKWGDKHEEILDDGTIKILREEFQLTKEELSTQYLAGNESIKLESASKLSSEQEKNIRHIIGDENVTQNDFERASHSYGKYFSDLLRLRLNSIPTPPDLVVYPTNDLQIENLLQYCHKESIAITPFGAGSSVTRAIETPQGGLSVDLSKNYDKVIDINTVNQTVKVQAGILGPALETILNEKGFTCGHFPQSFEFSSVGGWISARGAGQASTGYGKIEDLVLGLKVITPTGSIETKAYPKMAQAWNLNEIFTGAEGTLGIISEATLKVFKHNPQDRSYASFVFKDFKSATQAMREMIQAEYGKPHLFRLSDPKETDIALRMKSFEGSFFDKLLNMLGYEPNKRCLMFVATEGNKAFTKFVKRQIKKTAKKNKGLYIGEKPTKKWLEQRFHSAYLREPLMDMGIITDTLETSVGWEQLLHLWESVQNYMRSRPNTIVMTHLSHIYETGANLYFTFLSPMKKGTELEDYTQFHKGIVNAIVDNGGSLSHHHGVGRTLSPWLASQYNEKGLALFQGIKSHLDPKGIMNPGALGLK